MVATAERKPKEIDLSLKADVTIDESGHVVALHWREQKSIIKLIAGRITPVVQAWEFAPATLDGEPAETRTGLYIRLHAQERPDGGLVLRFEQAKTGPTALHASPPAYPVSAIRATASARVVAEFEVGTDGKAAIRNMEFAGISGDRYRKDFLQATEQMLEAWIFAPERVAGHASPTRMRVPIDTACCSRRPRISAPCGPRSGSAWRTISPTTPTCSRSSSSANWYRLQIDPPTQGRSPMTLSMYQASAPVFVRALTNLCNVLHKGEEHAVEKGFEPEVLLQTRLIPDMLPLVRQVQIAADMASRGSARLAGAEPKAFEDIETTFTQAYARIDAAIDYIESFKAEQIDGSEARQITLQMRNGEMTFYGQEYLLHFVLPNLFFHTTTAYDILRQSGVVLGKMDFMGEPKSS